MIRVGNKRCCLRYLACARFTQDSAWRELPLHSTVPQGRLRSLAGRGIHTYGSPCPKVLTPQISLGPSPSPQWKQRNTHTQAHSGKPSDTHVHTCAPPHIFTHIYTHTLTHKDMYVCSTHIDTHIHIHTYIHTYPHAFTQAHICVPHMYIHTYSYKLTPTYKHVYIHKYT